MGLRAPQTPQAPKQPLPEFQAQRKRVEQRINADTQGQTDAMQRRFAAQGMLNSGAAIKQQNVLANQAAQNREDALGQVDAAEIGEMQRRQEVQDQRDFVSNQAQMGRDFEGQQSQLGRDFAAGESKLGREFAAGESKLGRDFAASESALSRAMNKDQFDKTFGLEQLNSDRNWDMAVDEFNRDSEDQFFNKVIAAIQSGDVGAVENLMSDPSRFGGVFDPNAKPGSNRPKSTGPAPAKANSSGTNDAIARYFKQYPSTSMSSHMKTPQDAMKSNSAAINAAIRAGFSPEAIQRYIEKQNFSF